MSTLLGERINTGDVVELSHEGQWVSAMVLLATAEAVILDLCDGSVPFVVRAEELDDYRVFSGN